MLTDDRYVVKDIGAQRNSMYKTLVLRGYKLWPRVILRYYVDPMTLTKRVKQTDYLSHVMNQVEWYEDWWTEQSQCYSDSLRVRKKKWREDALSFISFFQ